MVSPDHLSRLLNGQRPSFAPPGSDYAQTLIDTPFDASLIPLRRFGCKMATGSGKTTVMGMLAAWSTLNKTNDRSGARYSDVVFIVCPNVTIRDRLRELDPNAATAQRQKSVATGPALPS